MNNLAELLLDRAERFGDRRLGMTTSPLRLDAAVSLAARAAAALSHAGIGAGSRVAVIGTNSDSYLVAWAALQLAGAEAALLNPTYPDALLAEMLADLEPDGCLWIGAPPAPELRPGAVHVDGSAIADGIIEVDGDRVQLPAEASAPAGLGRLAEDVAGYMHTSGTTGTPKFCIQTHEYFLRLGRFIADGMGWVDEDTVLAPLPLFHVNPLGYGVVGGLTAGASVLSVERFSASRFWPTVRENGVTTLVLHAPPVEILKRATTPTDAHGHRVRSVFFADQEFLESFGIPLGVSAYGSTEVGGLSHLWTWRRGERADGIVEGMSRYGGRARHDVEWRVGDDGEIAVRGRRPHVLFEGYRRRGIVLRPFDDEGWFATGDLGRVDDHGNLVFIERRAESIRVKGEFVPIGFVEECLARAGGILDVAVWRRPSELVDDELTAFVVADALDLDALRDASATLPAFMRPTGVVQVKEIPRDQGVGKVRRRQLEEAEIIGEYAL